MSLGDWAEEIKESRMMTDAYNKTAMMYKGVDYYKALGELLEKRRKEMEDESG